MSKLTLLSAASLAAILAVSMTGCGSDETTTTNELGSDLRVYSQVPIQGPDAGYVITPGITQPMPMPPPCEDCPIQPVVPTSPLTH